MTGRTPRRRVAWTVGRLVGRRLLGRAEGDADAQLGEILTGQLDEMKGLAMKLGQIISYMDVPLPDVVKSQLSRLQAGINGLTEAEARAVLAHAWGEGHAQRLEQFDPKPVAAASIGQVHRAVYQGQPIALKLQYPHVAASFSTDVGALRNVASLASLASAVDGQAIVTELGERLREECDYKREAAYQRAFRAAFSGVPHVNVPEVHAALTTGTTLATSWADGTTFQQACLLPQATRNSFAHTLVRFSYQSLFQYAAIQADPHPGNFLFGPGEQVTFLDFGCVREFDVGFVEQLRALVGALERQDRALFRQTVIELGMAKKPKRFDFDHYFLMMQHLHRPLLTPSFRFSREYVRAGLEFNGPNSPNARQLSMPPAYVWVARLQWGLWSLLATLEAQVELRELWHELSTTKVQPLLVSRASS